MSTFYHIYNQGRTWTNKLKFLCLSFSAFFCHIIDYNPVDVQHKRHDPRMFFFTILYHNYQGSRMCALDGFPIYIIYLQPGAVQYKEFTNNNQTVKSVWTIPSQWLAAAPHHMDSVIRHKTKTSISNIRQTNKEWYP